MFKKRLKLKKVRSYPAPAYPVVDEGEILSMPRELKLSDFAKPALPVLLATAILAGYGEADARGPQDRVVLVENSPDKNARAAKQDRQETPYPIRKFSQKEIASLIAELRLQGAIAGNIRGKSSGPRALEVTEEQGRQILEKFFTKNGIVFKSGVNLRQGTVGFTVDGYNAARKVGYEFVPCSGEQDLSAEEIAKIEKGLDGEHILLVKGSTCKVPQPQQVVQILQDAAEQFMRKLYREGILGRGQEISGLIRDLGLDEKAADGLKDIGPEAIWWIRQALKKLTDMESYAVDKDRLKQHGERLEAVETAIFEKDVEPLLEQLDAEGLAARTEAADKLIAIGAGIKPYVEQYHQQAEKDGNAEAARRCLDILRVIGD